MYPWPDVPFSGTRSGHYGAGICLAAAIFRGLGAKIEREEKGIPYHPEVIEWFHGICKELDIPWRLTASH